MIQTVSQMLPAPCSCHMVPLLSLCWFTDIGTRSPTDTICLYLLLECSFYGQLQFPVLFVSVRGLGILDILIFLVTASWSISPGLLLSRAQNEVDKCSKEVNFSRNDKYFSPLVPVVTQVCFRVLGSIRLRRREKVGPFIISTQEYVAGREMGMVIIRTSHTLNSLVFEINR